MNCNPQRRKRFVFKNITTNEIVQDTGDILHNVDEDKVTYQNKRISQHLFKINYELQKQYVYELTYSITTINGVSIADLNF